MTKQCNFCALEIGMQHFKPLDSAYFYVVANEGSGPDKLKC
jgi:hypothetical protein